MWGRHEAASLLDLPEDHLLSLARSHPINHRDKPSKLKRRSEPYINANSLVDSQRRGSFTESVAVPFKTFSRRLSEPSIKFQPSGAFQNHLPICRSEPFLLDESSAADSKPYSSSNECRATKSFGPVSSSVATFDSAAETDPYPERKKLGGTEKTTPHPNSLKYRRISEPYLRNLHTKEQDLAEEEPDLSSCNFGPRGSFPFEEFKVSIEENAYDLFKEVNMDFVSDNEKAPEEMNTDESPSPEDDDQSIFSLPWRDIIFPNVFTCLSMPDLFHLRAVSRGALACVDEYFTVCPIVNLSRVSQKFSRQAFQLVTRRNYRVRVLSLRQVKGWLTDNEFIPAIANSTFITKVDLTSCTGLTHKSMVALAGRAPCLRELYLRECPWMTMEAITMVAQNCGRLQRLDITGCWALQDEALISIALYCRELVYISIAKIYGVTDNAVHFLAKNCTKLQHINMHGCWRVTDNGVKILGEYCRDLRMLQVKDCRNISDISLARLRVRGVKVDVPQMPCRLNPETQNLLSQLKLQI